MLLLLCNVITNAEHGIPWRLVLRTRPQGIKRIIDTPQMTIKTLGTLDASKPAEPDQLNNKDLKEARPLQYKPKRKIRPITMKAIE
jgi:hypothetical protein